MRPKAASLPSAVGIVPGSSGWRSVFVFTITDEELGKWENINKSNHGVVANPEGQSIDYHANLSVTQPVSATEVEVSRLAVWRRPQG